MLFFPVASFNIYFGTGDEEGVSLFASHLQMSPPELTGRVEKMETMW